MAAYRFPVLLWEDHTGWFTAAVVESYYDVWAGAASGREALNLIKEALQDTFKRVPWEAPPDLAHCRLHHVVVPVRTEYEAGNRYYPSTNPTDLRVSAVTGEEAGGSRICYLPMFDVSFGYYVDTELPDLVRTQVQDLFRGKSPRDMMEYLPPRQVWLEEVVLQVKARPPTGRDLQPPLRQLSAIAEPLGDNRLRQQFSRAWERDAEVAELVQRLGHERANLILLGPSGIGKTSLLIDAARRLERGGEEEGAIQRYWLTSGPRIIAGMRYLGQWEERFGAAVRELASLGGVLCLERLVDVVRLGGEEATDSVAAFMSSFMQYGELRVVAEATPAELDLCRRLMPGFVEQFQIQSIPEFTSAQAMAVLERLAQQARQQWRLRWERGTAELIYRLHRRFLPYQSFPGRVTAFHQRLTREIRRQRRTTVTARMIFEAFARETGLPDWMLRDEMTLRAPEVEEALSQRLVGQPEACHAVANAVTIFKAALNDPERPIAVLLFLGPTGVGKTQLARTLADYLFGHGSDRDRMVRLDMSEYSGLDAADRLVMAPDGTPSIFLQRLRRQPFNVVLLDEIEKASPEVFDLLLNVLDEGRLTDRQGRVTWFRGCIIIMTSNLGARHRAITGFGEAAAPLGEAELMRFFRPEFVNRIDEVIHFRPLGQEEIVRITQLELAALAEREGLTRRQLRLTWDEEVVTFLARAGTDPELGARPLQRAIERHLSQTLAAFIVSHPAFREGRLHLRLDREAGIVMTPHPQP